MPDILLYVIIILFAVVGVAHCVEIVLKGIKPPNYTVRYTYTGSVTQFKKLLDNVVKEDSRTSKKKKSKSKHRKK